MEIAEIQEKVRPIMRQYGVQKAAVFGSVARGEDTQKSDVDLLVTLGKPMGIVAYMQFIEQVENALQRRVDMVTERSMSKYIRPHIESDLQTIYES